MLGDVSCQRRCKPPDSFIPTHSPGFLDLGTALAAIGHSSPYDTVCRTIISTDKQTLMNLRVVSVCLKTSSLSSVRV